MRRSAFTLIELLIVVGILAILSIVVLLVIKPPELLRQSRDANRVSDMATLTSALNLYATESLGSLGNASTTYVSVPDPAATSTAGDQCQGLGLPALASGETYQCAASSTYRLTNGQGWIPLNFNSLSGGTPFSELPVDPTNTTSSGFYYVYLTNGTQFEVAGVPESQKYIAQYDTNPTMGNYMGLIAEGTNISLTNVYDALNQKFDGNGLVAFWPLNETSGTVVHDFSGNGNNGTVNGGFTSVTGINGQPAMSFNGSSQYISGTGGSSFNLDNGPFSVTFWQDTNNTNPNYTQGPATIGSNISGNTNASIDILEPNDSTVDCAMYYDDFQVGVINMFNNWTFVAITMDGSRLRSIYVNAQLAATSTANGYYVGDNTWAIAKRADNSGYYFSGALQNIRVYNRSLSQTEILSLYNAKE